MDITDLSDTIIPKSDQLNAEQLLAGPIMITITNVTRSASPDQPILIHYDGDNGRPYKPCRTMRKLLLAAWGKDGGAWIGRSLKLYRDPTVKWAGEAVGGIRISHASHITKDMELKLMMTRGKYAVHKLMALKVERPADPVDAARKELVEAADCGMNVLGQKWRSLPQAVRDAISTSGCPQELKTRAAAADKARKDAEAVANPNAATHAALTALAAATPAPVDAPASATTAPATASGGAADPTPATGADPLADVAL